MGQVDGKVAIVTGGASGIGAASAAILAREGAKVVVTDIDVSGGTAVAARIANAGGEAVFLEQDVTDEARWEEVVAETERRFGRLDVLHSNAGIARRCLLVETPLEDWRRVQAINLEGVFLSLKHAIPAMRRAGAGSIIITSSIAGIFGTPLNAAYCATKGAVRLLAKSAAAECAVLGDSIRINTIHPGVIDTPLWTKFGGEVPGLPEQLAEAWALLGRPGTADEVAAAVLFLASDASRYMTASELVIDGGLTGGRIRPPRPETSPKAQPA
ncbi:MAG: glucose 1-dehydrogenase [Acetobacteraceae bacterium]|nr:glucose 1-dehydrogenase [Acetobacteraceae bacterium]